MTLGEKTITLVRRPEPTKNGDYVFRREGVKASIYINRRIFTRGTMPDTITLSSDEDIFRLPGNIDPDATEKRITMLEERAAKKRERAESQLTAADKLHTEAEALHASLDRIGQ